MSAKQFEEIFKKYYHELGKYALKYLRDVDLSDEIVQEVFVRLWKKRESLSNVDNIRAYLYSMVRNASIDYLRKGQPNFMEDGLDQLVDIGHSDENLAENHDLNIYIEKALKKLPKKCYAIFALKRFENLSTKETAKELNISEKTVENQMTIALKKIKDYLAKYGLP